MTYIPGAKAITDCPDSLAILIKQRRRWGNGALFGTMHTIKNMGDLLKPGRTKHTCCFKCSLFMFLLYYGVNFFASMIVVGGMYASINIFFS